MNSVTTPDSKYHNQTDVVSANRNGVATTTEVVNLMNQSGIAWKSDIDTKFDNIPVDQQLSSEMYLWQNPKYRFIIPKTTGQPRILNQTAWTTDATNVGAKSEHFIVWMRTAGLPNFRKLYGRIDYDLEVGTTLEFLVSSSKIFIMTHNSQI